MRVFQTKSFARFAIKSGIDDHALCKAVMNAENGLIDADLGGGVIKQRVARKGEGKSGGFRTIILFKIKDKAFFVYGFAKNEKSNIENNDLLDFRRLAADMLGYAELEIAKAVKNKLLIEVEYENKTISQ
ncbi:MAG: type II toxin-antitoxin system RelE/ParE family toxin [Pseudomonadota bacterium]